MRLWDLHKRRQIDTPAANGAKGTVAFAPDNRTIAFAIEGDHAVVWDVLDQKEICRVPGILYEREGELLFLEDGGKLLVASGVDGGHLGYPHESSIAHHAVGKKRTQSGLCRPSAWPVLVFGRERRQGAT